MDRPLRNSSRAPGWCVWRISPLAATGVSAPAGAQRGTPWAYGYIGEGMHSLSALRRVRWPKKVAYDPQFWFARAGLCGWARRLAPAGANLHRPPQGPLFGSLALVCACRHKPPSAAPRSAGTLGPLGRWSSDRNQTSTDRPHECLRSDRLTLACSPICSPIWMTLPPSGRLRHLQRTEGAHAGPGAAKAGAPAIFAAAGDPGQ